MKPLIIGLHNPLSTHPDDALYPRPPGCTGHRLLRLMQRVSPYFTDDMYLAHFDRANLWKGRRLPTGRGATAAYRAEGEAMRAECADRSIVFLLGVRVWDAVTRTKSPGFFNDRTIDGVRFVYLPHPSGRNLIYNDDDNAVLAGSLLLDSVLNSRTEGRR